MRHEQVRCFFILIIDDISLFKSEVDSMDISALSTPTGVLISRGDVEGSNKSEAPLLNSNDPVATRFKAVGGVAVNFPGVFGAHTGTGTVVAGSSHPDPNSPALLLTAGHVVLGPDGRGAVCNVPVSGSFIPANFKNTSGTHKAISFDRALYASIDGQDAAVVRLNTTYGELKKKGVAPMRLRVVPNFQGMPIETAHVPTDDIPPSERYMRYSKGAAQESKAVLEGEWRWPNMAPTNLSGIHGGSSGAPITPKGGNAVIGILTTGAERGGRDCDVNRPCEVDHNGRRVQEGVVYYTPVNSSLIKIVEANSPNDGEVSPSHHGGKSAAMRQV
jgi:hypothetical protein